MGVFYWILIYMCYPLSSFFQILGSCSLKSNRWFEPKLILVLSVSVSRSVMPDSLRPHGLQPTSLLCPWDFPGKNTGMGCHFLLQGIFPIQGSNPGLLYCRQILSPSELQEKPKLSKLKKTTKLIYVAAIKQSTGFQFLKRSLSLVS